MKKASVLKAVGFVATLLVLVLAVFFAVTAMVFSFGGSSAPDIFGYNVYLVSGGDFYQLKSGTAAIAQKVWPDEVNNGEIIIYTGDKGETQLARVNSSTLKEGVMSFDIESQTGDNVKISQSQLVARVNYCSDFWGAVIGFAKSPFGVMAVAILPCLAVIAYEIVKFIISKRPVPSVETIKLQEEAPVFLPKSIEKVPEKKKPLRLYRKKFCLSLPNQSPIIRRMILQNTCFQKNPQLLPIKLRTEQIFPLPQSKKWRQTEPYKTPQMRPHHINRLLPYRIKLSRTRNTTKMKTGRPDRQRALNPIYHLSSRMTKIRNTILMNCWQI